MRLSFLKTLAFVTAASLCLGVIGLAWAQQPAAPQPATPAPRVLKMQSTWPPASTLQENSKLFGERVDKLTGGALKIEIVTGVVPPFEVLDAVNKKVLDGGHTVTYYWQGKDSAATLFASTPAGPFGMDNMDFLGWMYEGGGLEMYWDWYQNTIKMNGEFLTLLGPSGSGKTTLLNLIAGFYRPTSGQIVINDQDITLLPPEKRDVGMTFQYYALFPHMTVEENIAFPLKMRKQSKAVARTRVEEVLNLVRMSGFANRYPNQLSGGQQQRVSLARSIVFNPSLLLMDEPLGALDKKLRKHMQIELKHLHKRLGMTVVYVTHDQEEALTMSNTIAIMNDGRIEQIGSPDDIYQSPASRFVADFIGESNFLEGKVIVI